MITRRESILAEITDMVSDFLIFDRRGDADLGEGSIEEAVAWGEITIDEMVDRVRHHLTSQLNPPPPPPSPFIWDQLQDG